MLSQRSARVNKDALTQVETLVALRNTGPQDRNAILDWVAGDSHAAEIATTLSSLADGEAWLSSPHWLNTTRRVRFDRRRTFDSGATPTTTTSRRRPTANLADIDIGVLAKRMAAVTERATADNPTVLRRRIAALEQQLANRWTPEPIVERVEVPVVDPALLDATTQAVAQLADLEAMAAELAASLQGSRAHLDSALRQVHSDPGTAPGNTRAKSPRQARRAPPSPAALASSAPTSSSTPLPAATPPPSGPVDVQLKKGARRMLEVLARHHPMQVTRSQLGALAGFKITGGTFQEYLSILRRNGLIAVDGKLIDITPAGLAAAGVIVSEPMTTDEVLAVWRNALKRGARNMLDHLVDLYPQGATRDALADHVEMTATGGTFQEYLSTLRRNGLVDVESNQIRASSSLFMMA